MEARLSEKPGLELLTPDEQHALWRLLLKGASPALACQQLGLSIVAYLETFERDAAFHASIKQSLGTLSDNVATSMYRSAIEGNVPAQKQWLEQLPSPLLSAMKVEEAEPDEFAHLSDDELAALLLETSRDLQAAGERVEAAEPV